MDIYETFVTKAEGLEKALKVIRQHGIPNEVNKQFLTEIGFKEPNSVLYGKLFKVLGLIDDDNRPVRPYYSQFVKSDDQSRIIIGKLMREKYATLFDEHKHAHKLPDEKLFALFRKRMDGKKSKTIVKLVANTFKSLAHYADWNRINNQNKSQESMAINDIEQNGDVKLDEAETPHEEFILELMNGESDHEYAKNGTAEVNGIPENGQGDKQDMGAYTDRQSEKIGDLHVDDTKLNGLEKKQSKEHSMYLSKALVRRAELLENLGRAKEAVEAYDEIIRYSENNNYPLGKENISNAIYKKATMLEEIDKYEQALQVYDELIQRVG